MRKLVIWVFFFHGNLQQAYFKCAHECFDRTKKKEEIENCVEYCSVPVLNAQNFVENEMANFQVKIDFLFKSFSFMFGSYSSFEILCLYLKNLKCIILAFGFVSYS